MSDRTIQLRRPDGSVRELALREVAPTGTKTVQAFVHRSGGGGGLEQLTMSVYPHTAHGEELRARRVAQGLGLIQCARRLGMTAADLSGLQEGRLQISEEDWSALLDALTSEEDS